MELKTTKQVAAELGLSQETLITYLSRHPDLRPTIQLSTIGGRFSWTEEEIKAVRRARATKKAGRPKKK